MKKIILFIIFSILLFTSSCNFGDLNSNDDTQEVPLQLTVEEDVANIVLNNTNEYVLKYSTNKEATFEIVCDTTDGYVLNDNKIQFSEVGTYKFTITAKSGDEVVSKDVVITVTEEIKPVITEYKKNNEFDMSTGIFYPVVEVEPSNAKIEYTSDKKIDVIEDGIKFNATGDYEITVKASLGEYSHSVKINVHVYNIFDLAGDGSQTNPWQITDASELAMISDAILYTDIDLNDKYFIQKNDIDLSEFDNWIPIGTIGLPFEGIYDGNNFAVNNLTINTADSFQGLFGFLTGIVKNVTVRGNIVVETSDLPYSHSLVGGIAGGMNNGAQIINCTNYVNITADSSAGGIVGEILETDYFLYGETFSKVIDCKNYGNIVANFANSINENTMYFGGISGKNHGVIENCINYGNVDAYSQKDETLNSNDYVGGITGYSYQPFYSEFGPNEQMKYAAIKNCKNEGDISGLHAVGGIVGQHVLQIVGCENLGEVTGVKSIGGIAGITGTSKTSVLKYTSVIDCKNSGTIISLDQYAGGIVGYTYDDIISCENNGIVKNALNVVANYLGGIAGRKESGIIKDCNNFADVSGNKFISGIVGINTTGTISECKNTGDISGSGYYVAGIVADNIDGAITNCINEGNITGETRVGGIVGRANKKTSYTISGCESKIGVISGTDQIGGIVGRVEGTDDTIVTIDNCKNESNVAGVTGYIGGIVGMHGSYNTVSNCINNGNISGLGYTDSENIGVGGISGQMHKLSKTINCTNNGQVTGERVTGGICGSAKAASTVLFEINGCTNNGQVICNYTASKDAWVGGILGYGSYGTLTNNINYGSYVNTNGAKYVGYIYGKLSNVTNTNNQNLFEGGNA